MANNVKSAASLDCTLPHRRTKHTSVFSSVHFAFDPKLSHRIWLKLKQNKEWKSIHVAVCLVCTFLFVVYARKYRNLHFHTYTHTVTIRRYITAYPNPQPHPHMYREYNPNQRTNSHVFPRTFFLFVDNLRISLLCMRSSSLVDASVAVLSISGCQRIEGPEQK